MLLPIPLLCLLVNIVPSLTAASSATSGLLTAPRNPASERNDVSASAYPSSSSSRTSEDRTSQDTLAEDGLKDIHLNGTASLYLDANLNNYPNRILLIRHGEKPPHGRPNLSRAGRRRAQCLRKFMGKTSGHDVGLILAESYNPKSRMRIRPYLTVRPLARDLGLDVDVSCERDDGACVRRVVEEFAKTSTKDVLICWKHSELAGLAVALGATRMDPYPDNRFDIMWVLKHRKLAWKQSENCPGIDDINREGKGDEQDDPNMDVDPFSFDKEKQDEMEYGEYWTEGQGEEQLTLS